MRSVNIICHCFAEKIPAFASMLTAQLSSLQVWRPRCKVRFDLCCCHSDEAAWNVGMTFAERFLFSNIEVCVNIFDKPHLFRRAIARNSLALKCDADICYHTDCDYLWAEGCLDALAAAEIAPETKMILPAMASIHKSHADGDREIARIVPGEVFEPDLSLFKPWRPKLCIGGLQIVPGDVARLGYLDGTKWTRPTQADDFQNTREDRAYRLALGGKAQVVNMPGLYRLRHSQSAWQTADSRLKQTANQ